MKANLSLVLDEKNEIRLDLMHDVELEDIDKYTTTKGNSSEIREEYKEKIEDFLLLNKKYTDTFKREGNKKGSIVITYTDENNIIKKLRVLYKDNIKKINAEFHYKRVCTAIKNLDDVHKTYDILSHFQNSIFGSQFHRKEIYNASRRISGIKTPVDDSLRKVHDKHNDGMILIIKNIFKYAYEVNKSDKSKSQAYFYLRLIDSYVEKNYGETSSRKVVKTTKGKIETSVSNMDKIKDENIKVVKDKKYECFESLIEEDNGQYSFIDFSEYEKKDSFKDYSYKEPYTYDMENIDNYEKR